jgi:hypothetical protein
MMKKVQKVALLDRDKRVIGEVFDAPENGYEIKIAGTFTANGDPVNVSKYKISRSKRNLEKAKYEQPVSMVNTKYGPVWTFHCVEDNQVVY